MCVGVQQKSLMEWNQELNVLKLLLPGPSLGNRAMVEIR